MATQLPRGVDRLLKMSPMAEVLSAGPVPLPPVAAPTLDELSVVVPPTTDPTAEDIERRYLEKVRAIATRTPRAVGDRVEAGDDVCLDVIGYADGKLLPFSLRFDWWTEVAPIPALPGLMEGVVGQEVGDSLELMLTLPATYPVEPYRGLPVRLVVDVRQAARVTPPVEGTPELFERLGLGDTLDAVMDAIAEELEEEKADQLIVESRNMVLDELVRRADPQVPRSLVDTEIRRRWGAAEGKLLVERGFSVEEQQEALDAWLADPMTRAEAEHRLKIGLMLRAITEAERLTLPPDQLEELLTTYAEPFGLSAGDVKAALKESKEIARGLYEMGWYLMAVDHVMTRARVQFT